MALYLNDLTANANNLTNVNGSTEVTVSLGFAQSSEAASLAAGSGQYFYAPNSASLSITGNMTVECWVKFNSLPSTSQEMFMLSKYRDDNNQISWTFALREIGGGYNLAVGMSDNGSNFGRAEQTFSPSTGVWYHLAFSFNPSTQRVQFYVNGSALGGAVSAPFSSIFASSTALQIGTINHGGSPSQYLDGVIDEVRIWNVVRTSTEVNANYNIEVPSNSSGLVAYYPFETASSPSSSISPSLSPSSSISSSISASYSPSASRSPSASISPSGSRSPSSSRSASLSPSSSTSPSSSFSPSSSTSSSRSPSISPSSSFSASMSPSASISLSDSPSPSVGYSVYSRGDEVSLPTTNTDLETMYSDTEELYVSQRDNILVGQPGAGQYMIHQFKNFVGAQTKCQLEWQGSSELAPSTSPIYLQIYNVVTGSWLTIASDTVSDADTDIQLIGKVGDATNYKDTSNILTSRIYQLAI